MTILLYLSIALVVAGALSAAYNLQRNPQCVRSLPLTITAILILSGQLLAENGRLQVELETQRAATLERVAEMMIDENGDRFYEPNRSAHLLALMKDKEENGDN